MVSSPVAVALLALVAALAGVQFSTSSASLHQLSTTTTTAAQALRDLLLLPAMGTLLAAVASIYRQLHRPHAAPSEVAIGVVCAAVGLLQFLLFNGGGDVTRVAALGPAAVLVLPAAATVSFFLGMALIFVHVHDGSGGPVQTLVRILNKVTLGAAVGIIGLMALALYA